MSDISTGPRRSPGRYEIRLKGHLDSRWAAWFDGLSLANGNGGAAMVCGPVADRSALRGLSRKSAISACRWSGSPRSNPASPMRRQRAPVTINSLKETDMTTTMHATAAGPARMTSLRKTALVAGIFS